MAAINLPGMNLQLDQANAGREQAQLRSLQENAPNQETREGLTRTAREFEAVFMNTLLKAMRQTVPDNKLFNGGGATKFYRQMHDAEIAKTLATGHAGMGIADLIVNQFGHHVDEAAAADQPETVPPRRAMPPAPPTPLVAARYQQVGAVGQGMAARTKLRGLATAQGAAVADTLHRFEADIHRAADKAGLDPALILAVVMEESGGDPQARSPKGATGLMQLMPGTAEEVGVNDATSPAQNLDGGSRYLAGMIRRYEGRLDLALAAYNAGPGNVDRAGRQIPDFPETTAYVERVLKRLQGLRDGTELATPQ